jgi:probable HAF family extracellular repeat protein
MNGVYSLSHIGTNLRANLLKTSTALTLLAVAYATLLPGTAQSAEPAGYDYLGFLNGGYFSYAYGVSADGKVVVGHANENFRPRAFRWTEAGAMVSLGILNSGLSSLAYGVSADGKVVVGVANDGTAGYANRAFRWTEASNTMVSLGTLNGGTSSEARGVSADGKVVVGFAADASSEHRAFRWTEASNTMVSLGVLNSGNSSEAYGISEDGKVVVGFADDGSAGNKKRAFRWTEAGNTMVSLGVLNSGNESFAQGVSADGKVVVGYAEDGNASFQNRAFRWTEGGNAMVSLGTINGGTVSYAFASNNDGSVVVGWSQDGNVQAPRAFRWTDATGMISVEDWLRNNGATVASDFTSEARGVTADGSVVVGTTVNSTAFIARVSSTGSGIIDVNEFYSSLAAKPTANVGINYAGTVLNGAHGEPMRNLLDVGQQSIWVTSDIGYDNGSASDGAFGLADFGYGLGLEGGATARFAFGGLYTDQDIDTGGNFINKGFYIAPEVTLPVAGNVYATVGAYYAPGKLSVTRGYLNGGVMDYSSGEADLDTWGAKLRFDWLNAATVSDWNLTPYASLTYAHAKLDAYTETGGGFPASFNSTSDHSTVVRAGVDGVHALNNDIRLLARAEAAYRFEDETAATSGTITGLSGFSFEGQDTNQFWLRGGLGAEVDVAGGTASLNVNVTTQGDDPTVWVRSGWKVKF